MATVIKSNFILTSNSLFCSMIKWVFEEVYSDLPQEIYDSCESLSSKIIPCAKMHQYNCMLEFHHSLQPRVDLSFYIISTTTSITSIELPSWWHAFLDICDHISSTPLSTSSDLSNIKKLISTQTGMMIYCLTAYRIVTSLSSICIAIQLSSGVCFSELTN